MNDLVLTPGPWGWRQPAGSRQINLCTVGRGILYVLSPARAGMNDATIRFGHRTTAELGGMLKEVPVRDRGSPDYLRHNELTPDARLIQAAPDMFLLLRRVLSAPGGASLPFDLIADVLHLLERIEPTMVNGLSVDDTWRRHKEEREKIASLGLSPPTACGPATGSGGAS